MDFGKPAVLFEDDDLLAISKPPGMLSQQSLDKKRPHVTGWIEKELGLKTFLHHRLDKDTSGVLVLGKSKRVNAGLTEIFREHQLTKIYWALSRPQGPSGDFNVINHIAPVRGEGKKLLRMVAVKSGGWRAETHFRCLEENERFHLVEATPVTGRTHQIRVHLAGVKKPIWGDFLYGGKSTAFPRLMLHAKRLSFVHPITKQELHIEAPVPKDFRSFLNHD